MKIQTIELKRKLKLLKPALDTKAQITALQGVLFKDNTLTAYNLETALTAKLDVNTEDSFIIPPKAIDIIQSITDDWVELAYDKSFLTIKFGKSKSKYTTVDVAEYPELPKYTEDGNTTEINALSVVEGTKKCMYAIATSEALPIHTGLLFNAENGKLDMVACDGYRLSTTSFDYANEFKFVVPRKTLTLIQSFNIDDEDMISITRTSKHIIFKLNEYCIISRLLDGDFLNYKQAIPNHSINITVNRQSMLEVFNRINLLQAGQHTSPAKVTFKENEIYAEINVQNSEYNETINVESNLTQEITIGMNSHYVVDCLRSFNSEEITLHIGGAISPIVVTADNQRALVLPVRLK